MEGTVATTAGRTKPGIGSADLSGEGATALAGRCPGCGNFYGGKILPYLYTDEVGAYCYGCGGRLVEERSGALRESSDERYVLTVPERLEGSALHRRLEEMAATDGARVLVDRSGRLGVRPTPQQPRTASAARSLFSTQGR